MRIPAIIVFLCAGLSAHADMVESWSKLSQRETEIRWLWKYASAAVQSCLKTAPECRDPELRPWLEKLVKEALPLQPQAFDSQSGKRLRFVSEKTNPDLFVSDKNEKHRLAVTELRPGAEIFVNTDRMQGPSVFEWLGILVHEASHHLKLDDTSERLPDRLGAAVAAHAKAVWQTGNLAEFGHPEIGLLILNDPSMTQPARILLYAENVGSDNNATPNPRVPICKPGETFAGQTVGAPLWRVMYLRGDQGLARIRGGARVNSRCVNAKGVERLVTNNFSVLTEFDFKTMFDPKEAWWELPSTLNPISLTGGVNDSTEEMFDLQRSFHVISLMQNQKEFRAGDEWRLQAVVESTDGFVPKKCNGLLSGSRWFFSRAVSTQMYEPFHECGLTHLRENRWQIDLRFKFPAGAQPDLFNLSFIHFANGAEDRFAFPPRPAYVQLKNPEAAARMKIAKWLVRGLEPREKIENLPLKNSFKAIYGKSFWVEFEVSGTQKIKRQFMDFDFMVHLGGSKDNTVLMPWNPRVDEIPELITKTEIVAIPGGQRIRYQMSLPPTVNGMKLFGFKLRRLNLETDDFTWVEGEIVPFTEGLFLTDEIP